MQTKNILFLLGLIMLALPTSAQKEYMIGCIGFYNMENLFDTLESRYTWDTEFTPTGNNLYTSKVYHSKLDNLSKVVSEIGTDMTPDGLSVLGVAEIENRSVLEDFVKHPNVRDRNYQIVHYESPDFRGIDVALLYNPSYYTVTSSKPLPMIFIEPDGDTTTTRDILFVSGIYRGDPMHFLVNHWPSRRGGEKATRYKRNQAAAICKRIVDSLIQADPYAKVIVMGDLNDDPVSPSVKKVLRAKAEREKTGPRDMYNPMVKSFKQGIGSNAWRDAWSLFDQILLSYGFVQEEAGGFQFYKSGIYNPRYMVQKSGRYQGYPFRTYSFGVFIGGYSDHFPVFTYIVKEKSQTEH